MEMTIRGASILITGATGSFGNAFVDRAIQEEPRRIVIYSRDEQKQEAMARRLGAWGVDHRVFRFFIGDVRDLDRLTLALHGIDTVIHAAALKIVPTAEYNPTECIATNICGAQNVIHAALRTGVKRVLALSTDKAVNPINLYGASKLVAEKTFLAANALAAGSCKFSIMRYGNVVGSRGSVLPLFKKLAQEGKPITVTDIRMTRFWITLPQAVDFSIRCLSEMEGHEIFVPVIPSISVNNLAKLYSDNIIYTGIRPGEKLHEILISEDEIRLTHEDRNMYIITPNERMIRTSKLLPPEFSYRSDTNPWWLTAEELRAMI